MKNFSLSISVKFILHLIFVTFNYTTQIKVYIVILNVSI